MREQNSGFEYLYILNIKVIWPDTVSHLILLEVCPELLPVPCPKSSRSLHLKTGSKLPVRLWLVGFQLLRKEGINWKCQFLRGWWEGWWGFLFLPWFQRWDFADVRSVNLELCSNWSLRFTCIRDFLRSHLEVFGVEWDSQEN